MTAMPVTAPSQNRITSSKNQLKTDDFIKMMLTQLQNQDPLEPAKNQELLAQMSQIGQLQTATQLQDTLKGLALQNQLGSAGNLIGKLVQGLDANNDDVVGLVDSVRVEGNEVFLELDNGKTLSMRNVIAIANPPPNRAPSAAAPLK
jgi:flagellar basal-body rod modification protein FlgD